MFEPIGISTFNPVILNKPTAVLSGVLVRGSHSFKVGGEWRIDAFTNGSGSSAPGVYNFSNAETGLPYTQGQSLSRVALLDCRTPVFCSARWTAPALRTPPRLRAGNAPGRCTRRTVGRSRASSASSMACAGTTRVSPERFTTASAGSLRPCPTPPPAACWAPLPIKAMVQGAATACSPRPIRTPSPRGWALRTRSPPRRCSAPAGASPTDRRKSARPILAGNWAWVAGIPSPLATPTYGQPALQLSDGLNYNLSALYAVSTDPGIRPSPGQLNAPPALVDPNAARPPRMNQWNIALQREITRDLIVEAAYVGNRGVWFVASSLVDLNALTPQRLAVLRPGYQQCDRPDAADVAHRFGGGTDIPDWSVDRPGRECEQPLGGDQRRQVAVCGVSNGNDPGPSSSPLPAVQRFERNRGALGQHLVRLVASEAHQALLAWPGCYVHLRLAKRTRRIWARDMAAAWARSPAM